MRKRHSAENGVRCELHFDFRTVLESEADVVFGVNRRAVDHAVPKFIGKLCDGIRRREFGRFIHSVEELPEMVTEFSEELWGSLVDHVTVHNKDNIVFTLTSGLEIKA